jgi:DNA-binding Xre family transcriptional regulator
METIKNTLFEEEEKDKQIIEEDSDINKEEENDNNIIYPENLRGFEIGIKEDKFSVYELLRQYQNGRIILDAEFQRNLVWNKNAMSRFIESIILDLPIPALFFNQTVENKYIVVDGRQRLSALISFLGKAKENDVFDDLNFKLIGLKGLPHLNGKTYQDLKEYIGLQARIEDKSLNIFVIKPSVKLDIIYDIFDRINTGGTKLNKQEVRNALLAGKSTKLLQELARKQYFKEAINNGISDKRMKAQETVLRILSFMIFDYEIDYKGSMSNFLELGMRELNKTDDNTIDELRNRFEKVMKLSYSIFGENNFSLQLKEKSKRINLSIMDSICHFLDTTDDNFIEIHKEKIRENYETLVNDIKYRNAVTLATSSSEKVQERFYLAKIILSNV